MHVHSDIFNALKTFSCIRLIPDTTVFMKIYNQGRTTDLQVYLTFVCLFDRVEK